ncbi:MAG TPA: phosphopyruvate hydratase [Solirubrobacteraceae bacterium]|nr:phosphopyruvate hydratase [Solirubrobacteraceae bacterium]
MTRIASLLGREILDSRGRPTIEVQLTLSDGRAVTASVPSGASTGRHEAVERRDGDPGRYGGLGVLGAIAGINGEVAAALTGHEVDARSIDTALIAFDGSPDKSRLGANAILAVSLAAARAEAEVKGLPLWRSLAGERPVMLPMPMVNIISGGLHADRQLDFQDFMVIPASAETYSQALEMVCAVHRATGEVLAERGLTTLRADEGGFGPPLARHQDALALLDTAVERAGFSVGGDILYALDVAATHFYDGEYRLASEDRALTAEALNEYLCDLVAGHPVVSVEDPFAEDDWDGFVTFTATIGDRLQVVGDDLFTTNLSRLGRGIAERAANAVLVKMNQIGTISETLDVVTTAKQAGFRTVISARSGETEDAALADLAVGCDGGQIKVGSITQSERLAKYNQLLRIEHALGDDAVLASWGRGA